MYKIIIILLFSLIIANSECIDGRYQDQIFDVSVQYNIQYGQNVNHTLIGTEYMENLFMDIYLPNNDDFEERPLIFFLYGGAYVGGSRTSGDIVSLCTNYAKMGYVAVAIDYRLSQSTLFFFPDEEDAYKAVLKAIHDLKAAIRYFKMNDELYNEYRIDSDRVFAGGVSAGAITSINAVYLDEMSELPTFLLDDFENLGGFEGFSGNPGYDSSFSGIVNLCGAVGDADWIKVGDIPIVSMHGDQDDIVPYDDSLVTLFGLNVQVDGSYMIHQKMVGLGNYSALHTYENQGHVPFSNMEFEIEFTKSFLYDIVCGLVTEAGDLNADGNINVTDIVLLVNLILEGGYTAAADINQDSVVNIVDIVLLVQIILNN